MTYARAHKSTGAPANLLALGAILLWGTLAWLGVRLAAMPPFLLVGVALTAAGVLALPTWRAWRVRPVVLALGIYGLFGFHFFLFVALRLAPPLQANVVNYLWPLFIVLLAPLFLPGVVLTRLHVIGGLLGLSGALLAITNGRFSMGDAFLSMPHAGWGYAAALTSALIWASYSLMGRRLRMRGTTFPTAALGACCLASGLLALACHAAFEASYIFNGAEALPLIALAIGPMGGAFFLWDAALATGDARTIGTLAYLTPVLSTVLLGLSDPTRLGWPLAGALALVIAGAVIGTIAGSNRT
jgi:drug/metabolite transporter (DMT)-like permease